MKIVKILFNGEEVEIPEYDLAWFLANGAKKVEEEIKPKTKSK